MLWFAVVAVAASVASSLLTKKPPRRVEAPEPTLPKNELGASIPTVFNVGKVGGNIIYATQPYKVTETIGGKGGAPSEIRDDYQVDYMVYLLSAIEPVNLERLDLNGEMVYAATSTDPNVIAKGQDFATNHFTFFHGTGNQNPSSELEALEGVGSVPAFRYVSYIILKDIKLSRYGNTYPSVQATLKSQTQYNLGGYLRRVIELAKVNVTSLALFTIEALTASFQLDAEIFQGTIFNNDSGSWLDALTPIMEFHQLVLSEKNGGGTLLIEYPLDTQTATTTLTTIQCDEILGTQDTVAYQVTDFNKDVIPNVLTLTFPDPSLEFDANSVTVYNSQGEGSNDDEIRFRFNLDRNRALTGAERMLRAAWSRKQRIEFNLPITKDADIKLGALCEIQGNDLVNGKQWLLSELSFSNQMFVRVLAERFNAYVTAYESGVPGLLSIFGGVIPSTELDLILKVLVTDTVLLDGIQEEPLEGIYVRTDLGSANFNTYGYLSEDNFNYTLKIQATGNAVVFTALPGSTLINVSGYIPDRVSYLDILLFDDTFTPTNITEEELFQGKNILCMRKEYIAFKNVEVQGVGRYRLSHFIRGFRNTKQFIEANTTALPLYGAICRDRDNSVGNKRLPLPLDDYLLGTKQFKVATSSFSDLDGLTPIIFEYEGNSAKAAGAVVLPAARIGANWEIKWVPVSRNLLNHTIKDGAAKVPSEDGSVFEVSIFVYNSLTPLRTTVVNATSYIYTAAQQAADGYDVAQGYIRAEVYQITVLSSIAKGFKSNNFLN
jgi:Putative phage tail protein